MRLVKEDAAVPKIRYGTWASEAMETSTEHVALSPAMSGCGS